MACGLSEMVFRVGVVWLNVCKSEAQHQKTKKVFFFLTALALQTCGAEAFKCPLEPASEPQGRPKWLPEFVLEPTRALGAAALACLEAAGALGLTA